MTRPNPTVFDGHNDTLLRIVMDRRKGREIDFLAGVEGYHIDLPKAQAGGLAGGLFAMFSPNPDSLSSALGGKPAMGNPISQEVAEDFTYAMMDAGDEIVAQSGGAVRHCTSAAEIRTAMQEGALAMVYHIEGAEVIAPDLGNLDALYTRGLRSVGPVWSRDNVFAHGVPFSFPASPDHGPGLTAQGEDLVRACNAKGLMLDLSHLNEKGFWDIARLSDKPLVASHSNVHALSPTPRNLTDRQLDAIAESGGLVGLNFAVGFLREDGNHGRTDTPIAQMIAHLDYLLEKLGEAGVGIGSDFDGASMPREIGDARGLPLLVAAMAEAGYGEDLIARITHGNWIDLLERTWVA
ncbi:dipeptidase [Pelagibacterium montanilacus]|uniref:dipeptidase n=1 Tax=Pelagibacterium montanilacus TaxID=2185280 RepID=UPI000F8CE63B|nr:dipeptidase [Pelagibacterium montanilacus]